LGIQQGKLEASPAVSTAVTLLVDHGYVVLFAYVLLSQLGTPLPSGPLIMAAGALAATGRISFANTIAVVVFASLCADTVWYHLGRTRGGSVVRMLCRISLEPEACVRRTKNAFGRYGGPFLLIAKFLPGLGLMAAPIAGQTRMAYRVFLAFDFVGALAWTCAYGSIGLLLGEEIARNGPLFQAGARFGAVAVLGAVVGVLAVRLLRRRRFRQLVSIARITPAELKARMDLGERLYIVDLRHPLLLGAERRSLPGAVHFTPEEVIARKDLIPRDREIVLFCDCPGEASAALVATALRNHGFPRARPLEGGLEGWRLAGYPLGG
jgi:membrane protein DedA with SNARE-associated domain/rhodanese-related sulfurtransferase